MKEENNFDDIRPYTDAEIPAAMARIAESVFFPSLATFLFPGKEIESIKEYVKSIKSIYEFQSKIMATMNRRIIEETIGSFTYGGLENLSPQKSYLFIANHRDIVLDSSLLQYILFNNGFATTEITFGANLMHNKLIVDIGKSNKMFRLERPGGSIKEFYLSSLHVSRYMRKAVCKRGSSVWIAQRNGRTKDGIDATDQGVIKMLGISGTKNKVDDMAELNIVPVAISYEWEPCDILKALELYQKRESGKYIKKPGEDINSILTGMMQQKGAVHIEVCKPLEYNELLKYDSLTHSDFNRAVCALIDERINRAYRLTPNNFIAYDLRYGKNRYAGIYSEAQMCAFKKHILKLNRYEADCDVESLADILIGIYSNPVEYGR